MMNKDILATLRQARDINLDLFSEYVYLAIDNEKDGDDLKYRYWMDRAREVSRVIRVIGDDLLFVEGGDKA